MQQESFPSTIQTIDRHVGSILSRGARSSNPAGYTSSSPRAPSTCLRLSRKSAKHNRKLSATRGPLLDVKLTRSMDSDDELETADDSGGHLNSDDTLEVQQQHRPLLTHQAPGRAALAVDTVDDGRGD
ncbi:hypothetical protein JG687_00008363 [Phytophthora cactorum]|uniref:Uncharacterized protein n=2 Tax=Phytophthora cactorum TaxID=29920 RepID=A0A8T1UHP8_9STRA|nr:hypothetical protein JG687_00008363 [Phytophthora cactorum]